MATRVFDNKRYVFDSGWGTKREANRRVERLHKAGLLARSHSPSRGLWNVWSYPHSGAVEGIPV